MLIKTKTKGALTLPDNRAFLALGGCPTYCSVSYIRSNRHPSDPLGGRSESGRDQPAARSTLNMFDIFPAPPDSHIIHKRPRQEKHKQLQ